MSQIKNLKSNRRGLMIVLSSPSGAGKTTLTRKLLAAHNDMSMSVSATTRKPRPGEVDGHDYYFVSKDKFSEMIDCLLYTSPSPRDATLSRMPSSA